MMVKKGRRANNLAKISTDEKKPVIIVKDLPLTEKYYRITCIKFDKEKYSKSRKEKTSGRLHGVI